MKKKWIISGVIGVIIFVLLCSIPSLLDYFIWGNNIPSNLSNAEWASFLGGYIGAIVSGVISLIGISLTIIFTKNQNKLDREYQIRPYFDIRFKRTEKFLCLDKNLGHIAYSCDSTMEHRDIIYGMLYIKNVGIGPAVNCNFTNDPINDGRSHYPMIFTNSSVVGVTCLQSGEEGSFSFQIAMNFPIISQDRIFEKDGQRYIDPIVFNNVKNHSIVIKFTYQDMLLNLYSQTIALKVQINIGTNNDGQSYTYGCDLYLDSISSPEKVTP